MKAHISASCEVEIDEVAHKFMQVEILPEAGQPGMFKLYVHEFGKTTLRICKLTDEQLVYPGKP